MEKIRLLNDLENSIELMSVPSTLSEVLQAVESESASPDQIAKIILKDASLTAKILKMANSSYYRRNSEIKTVQQAVLVLGANTVTCLALSVSIFSDTNNNEPAGYDVNDIYMHSLGVGVLSRAIAEEIGFENKEEAFVAGLLHDIGRMFIMRSQPDAFMQVVERMQTGEDSIDIERELFDVDHAELGAEIAARWYLPQELQRVIRRHHHNGMSDDEDKMVLIVRLADLVAHNINSSSIRVIERNMKWISDVSKFLNIDQEFLNSLTFVMVEDVVDTANNIGLDLGSEIDLMKRANQELCKAFMMIEELFKERQELTHKMLAEERLEGMLRSKNIAIATLSHYLNNVATAISGRVQLMQLGIEKNEIIDKTDRLAVSLNVIDNSITKILAVLDELKSLSRFDDQTFYNDSDALNIDERIKERMEALDENQVTVS